MVDEVSGSPKASKDPNGKQGNRGNGASSSHRRPPLYLNDIRERAYEKWVTAGKPQGDDAHFWLEAEQELQEGR
jgi:hypothetical protein